MQSKGIEMTNRAEFERLLDVYGFRCERFGQDLSTHARAQVVSAFAALASATVAGEAQQNDNDPEYRAALSRITAIAAAPQSSQSEQKPFAWAQYVKGYHAPRLFLASDITDPTEGHWTDGVTWQPLYAAPQASEAVRDAGITASEEVALPPLPSPPQHRGHAMFAGSQMEAYARAAVLADRLHRAGDAEGYEKMRDVLQWIVDDASSGGVAKLRPQQEKRARAALSAQPGAQRTGGGE